MSGKSVPEQVWPGGDYKLSIEDQKCEYKCDGTNAGRLFCEKKEVGCQAYPERGNGSTSMQCAQTSFMLPVVYCDF